MNISNLNVGSLLAFGFPGMPELLIVLVIALVLFGGAKLPSLMRNLGRSANEFKRGMSETVDDDDDAALSEHASHRSASKSRDEVS